MEASDITLYYDLLSQPSRSLYIFLSVNKIHFERKMLNLMSGDHRSEEYRLINPLRKVPAITRGNFKLSESVAIVRYLSRRDVNGGVDTSRWYPENVEAQAQVDQFLEFHHIGLRHPCEAYFLAMVFDPLVKGKTHSTELLSQLKKEVDRACRQLQDIWLSSDKPYICGSSITVADIFAASELEQLKLTNYDPRDGRPVLANWLNRVRAETNPYYDEAHSALDRLAKQNEGTARELRAKN